MDINWFVQVLKQGETYKAQNTEGESYQVNRPPTSTSIKAANIIQQLSAQIEQNAEITQNLMRQLHDANSQLELFYKIRDQETKKVD